MLKFDTALQGGPRFQRSRNAQGEGISARFTESLIDYDLSCLEGKAVEDMRICGPKKRRKAN
jgi:hypothetical protein